MRPLESVPNFSEGRDRATIDALADALGSEARLLDVHADEDHNRSVFTLVGSEDELIASLLAGIACAVERIDLRRHEGAHPRVGAADVVPIVPLVREELGRATACAEMLAARVGSELGLPVFRYGELAPGRGPAFFRTGGLERLERRVEAGELVPDEGPASIDRRSGGVLVGARRALIAFNVNLRGSLDAAREAARAVRERGARGGRGGGPGRRGRRLGARRPDAGRRGGRGSGRDAANRPLRRLTCPRAAAPRVVTRSPRSRYTHVRFSSIRSPRGGGRANRTKGR
jgi:glutamate formiminotransferase